MVIIWFVLISCFVNGDLKFQNDITTSPVMLIPGLASTQLQAWNTEVCQGRFGDSLYKDVHIGERIWIDVSRVLAHTTCWLNCMKLDIRTQADNTCRLRAGEGIASIAELDPGYVTGPLSTVWRSLIEELVEDFDLPPEKLLVASYDWRLPPSRLQERDCFFLKLKWKFEEAIEQHGTNGRVVVIAHSMGNNVFRYFLAWIVKQKGKVDGSAWIDRHIRAYFAVGAPLLGSGDTIESIYTGMTNGLPISIPLARSLQSTFGSTLGMLPIAGPLPNDPEANATVFSVQLKDADGQLHKKNYSLRNISDGTLFRQTEFHDPLVEDQEIIRSTFYENDTVMEHFTPWKRPPIEHVYVVYGTGIPSRERFSYTQGEVPGTWVQNSMKRETGDPCSCHTLGDGTVTYYSLSYGHLWLGPNNTRVNITRVPQHVYFSKAEIQKTQLEAERHQSHAQYSQMDSSLNCERKNALCTIFQSAARYEAELTYEEKTIVNAWLGHGPNDKHATFFETSRPREERDGMYHTTVLEIQGAGHREILGHPTFQRELTEHLRNVFQNEPFSDKTTRPPTEDTQCYWNYPAARCALPQYCGYSYSFGDITLDQSCRVLSKATIPTDKLRPESGLMP